MKKLLFFVAIVLFGVWYYFWYIHGVNLIVPNENQAGIPEFSISEKMPENSNNESQTTKWRMGAAMSKARIWSAAATLNGRIYVIGGMDGFGRTLDSVEVYDPIKNSWGVAPSLPERRHHLSAVTVDGKIYVIGGFSGVVGEPHDEVYVFDPNTLAWSEITTMPQALGSLAAVAVEGGFHIFGGRNVFGPVGTHSFYDIMSNQWTVMEEMTSIRDGLSATVNNGTIWVIGGRAGSSASTISLIEHWNISNGTWGNPDALSFRKSDFSAKTVDNKIYIIGGEVGTTALRSIYVYDSFSNSWNHLTDMSTPRHGFASAVFENMIFIFGGGQRTGFSVSNLNQVMIP